MQLPDPVLKDNDAFEAYENGKHRRYSLLFSVNGGAFAVAKLLTSPAPGQGAVVLGGLTLQHLAFGMAVFTLVMAWDIYLFGEKMRRQYLPGAFGPAGKTVLALLAVLVSAGWLLVAL